MRWLLKRSIFALLVSLIIFVDWSLRQALAASVPVGFTETIIPGPNSGNWNKAVGVTFDTAERMFVWELGGRVWIKGPAETNFTLLLDIGEERAGEGLLGFALDPNFQANGHIYLLYTVDRHHLLYFGTTNYNPNLTLDNEATIGRLTRYTCVASNDFKSVDPASRFILIGDSKTNGIPYCGTTHNVGSLVFGEDGTLLISTGDTASFYDVDTGGPVGGANVAQAVADGILRPKENVGGYRSQLVDCLNGKVLRIDPVTGDGVPSNPFYDASNPRAAKSRVWALGLRNPFRMTLRPGSGSHNPADANPGALYIGEVGWDVKESLKVVTGPGQNFGWPLFEGLELTLERGPGLTYNTDVLNLDAPNPLYPGGGCSQYFSFRQLLKQDTTNAASQPPFNNPCNVAVKIPGSIPQFLHRRPVLDWDHYGAVTRTPTFNASGGATIADVGGPGSPVSGTQFQGNCSVGGAWYVGTGFPEPYRNKYFHSDWGAEMIKLISFDTNNRPTAVNNFASVGPVVCIVPHPSDGSLYYVPFDGDIATVRKLAYTGNRTPVAVASADQFYGPGPLTVQFSSAGSADPDEQALSYSWNFGDGTAPSTAMNPSHVFAAPGSTRTNYTVTLTVTDTGGLPASTTLNVAVNETPPNVTITSPTNATLYSTASNTPFSLNATVFDAESSGSQLQYRWQTVLHHNDHNHVEATSTNHVSSTMLEPVGCDGMNVYYYRVILTVTDPRGLATTREVDLFPDCGVTDTPPTISDITNQSTILGLATVPIPFTIGDAQVAAANLQLGAGSSDPVLVPTNNIVFSGFGANRFVTVTPASSLSGTVTITVTVNDGPNEVSDSFELTVGGSNTPPTISGLVDQVTPEGTPTVTNAFTIGDANTPAGSLTLSGWAANPALVPPNSFTFGGSGPNRTVSVIPAAGQTGSTTITIAVSDGQLSASNSFNLTVTVSPSGTKSFTNATAIVVPDVSLASPYPSIINVAGLGGAVSNVAVSLRSLNYQWGRDLDVLLVSPGGQAMIVMSDAGTQPTAVNANLTFSNNAAAFLNQSNALVSGIYKPTDYPPADVFLPPAPAGLYATNFSVFNGLPANGVWSLYVVDDGSGDTGSISGGWSLTIATQPVPVTNTPPTISAISNQMTHVNTPTAPIAFTLLDAETASSNLVLMAASSNPGLLPTNNIAISGNDASRTVVLTPVSNQLGSLSIVLTVSDGAMIASNSFVLTVNPAPLTVTASSTNKAYGATLMPLSFTVTGLFDGDSVTNVSLASTGSVSNAPVGAYDIVPSDASGAGLSNYAITYSNGVLTVLPPGPVTISSAEFLDADHLRLRGQGDANVTYIIQSSPDLVVWSNLGTTVADGSGAFEFVDATTAAFTMRFYRITLP